MEIIAVDHDRPDVLDLSSSELHTRELRTSNYTIYVDLPDEEEQMLLVHGYTGAYDRVSQRVATYVRSLQRGQPAKPLYGEWSPEPTPDGKVTAPSEHAIKTLEKRGYLTRMTRDEEFEYFGYIAKQLHQSSLQGVPSYIIMPTYQCNLRCPYCFQDHMRTDPDYEDLLTFMDEETADLIMDAMPQVEERHGIDETDQEDLRRSITFFGGEPLLEECRPIVEYFMRELKRRGKTSFSAISNATDLEHYHDLIGPGFLEQIQVTLDGPPGEHDKRRVYPDGSGSFDEIADNITMALDLGARISVRMNVDHHNVDQLPELGEAIIEHGWNNYDGFVAYTAAIHASNDSTDESTTMSSYEVDQAIGEMKQESEAMNVIHRPDDGLRGRIREIFDDSKDPLPSYKTSYCGAHTRMYIFDPFANIYACWERTGDERVRIGQVTDGGTLEMDERGEKMWRKRNVTTNPVCSKCRYSMYCGGGCAVLAEADHDTMYMNHCDDFQKRFRTMAAEAFHAHQRGDSQTSRLKPACET